MLKRLSTLETEMQQLRPVVEQLRPMVQQLAKNELLRIASAVQDCICRGQLYALDTPADSAFGTNVDSTSSKFAKDMG